MVKSKVVEGTAEVETTHPTQERLEVPCCPELATDRACDVLDFHYRLIHTPTVTINNRTQRVTVEVIIHARLERCTGSLALGDLVHSLTLLPGEKVRLFSTDRRTRFSFDSATKVSYRREQTSEERYYMSAMSDFMSDVTVRDEARAANTRKGSFETHGDTSGVLETIFSGPSVDVSGSYNAESTSEFTRELRQHAEASSNRSVEATRAANSVSVGEVQSRTHAEGETEDHFESSTRVFSNPNRCHATTFFFYQINKTQTVKFTLEAIQRRVIDPAADTRVTNNPFTSRGEVAVIPTAVLATDKERLDLERAGRNSAAAQFGEAVRLSTAETLRASVPGVRVAGAFFTTGQPIEPLPPEVRAEALKAVDRDLVSAGLLDKEGGTISTEAQQRFSFEVTTSLPTPGLLVRGCLDDCNICEPALLREIDLDLERKKLENDLLSKKIDLLEKSQEYRCCPGESKSDSDDDDDDDDDKTRKRR